MRLGVFRSISFFCSLEVRAFRKESFVATGKDVGHGSCFAVKDRGNQVLWRSIYFVRELCRMFPLSSEGGFAEGGGHQR
ncbi:hypothetical protein HOY82DRAFT_565679, partial [Tuber indicum]